MANGPTPPVRGGRPSVEIDGQRDATLTSALMSLLIIDGSDGLARGELVFGNWGGTERAGFQHFGRDRLEFGKSLTVTLDRSTLFEGRITAITAKFPDGGPPQVGVCADDRLQDLRMTRRTRTFADASTGDVLRQIAGDHGLQAEVDVSGETYKVLAQLNQSDLAFARDLARREDAQVWVEGTTLKAAQRASRQGGTLDLSWAGELREFDVSADLAHQRTRLIGAGWNVADKEPATHEADESAVSAELNGGDGGASTLQRAFGARADTLAHGLPVSGAQARVLAEATFRHLARRFVVGRGVAETKPELRVGAKLNITGVGKLFEGEYTVTDVAIRYDDAGGLRTEFRCDRPAIGRP
jgi:phage protein D